jgi:HlyD family secretion protein
MLLPGMTANVTIVTDRRENVLRVPNDATRFRPADAPEQSGNTASSGGNQRGGNLINEQVIRELGLSKEQQERLQRSLQAVLQQGQSQQNNGPAGLNVQGNQNWRQQNAQSQAMRNRIENTLASVLTPEQMEKFRKLNSQRGAVPTARAGTLWTLVDGVPRAHEVMLGVADDRYTELIDAGDLKPGDKVILRGRTEVAR